MQQSTLIQRPTYPLSSTALAGGWLVMGCALAGTMLLGGFVWPPVATCGLAMTLALLCQPQFATVVVVFLLYINALPVANMFYGVPKLAAAALPALLFIPLFHELIISRRPVVLSSILLPTLAFLGIQAIGVVVAAQPDVALKALATSIAEGLLLFVVLTNVIRTRIALRLATWAAVAAGTLMGGLGILQYATGTFDNHYGGFAQVEEFDATADANVEQAPRLAGPLGQKNRYAHFMLMLLPLGLCLAWTERIHWLRYTAYAASSSIALGTALTLSRGAAVGFVALILGMTLLGRVAVRYLVALFVIGLVILVSVPQYAQRLESVIDILGMVDGSKDMRQLDIATVGRLTEMWAGAQVFCEHPIVGVGGDMFPYHFLNHAGDLGVQVHTEPRKAHNLYLGIAAEHGLLGLLSFAAIIVSVFRLLARTRKLPLDQAPEIPQFATAFMLAIGVYMVVGMFVDFSYVRYFWLIVALACATHHIGITFSHSRDQEQRQLQIRHEC